MSEPRDGAEDVRPSGIPYAESSARRRLVEAEEPEAQSSPKPELKSLRPATRRAEPTKLDAMRPPGLKNMTTSARLRLELAFDDDEESDTTVPKKKPSGLGPMTTSARLRLELALESDDDEIAPPRLSAERLSFSNLGTIPFDEVGRATVRSLMRWVGFCGVMSLALGALTGLSYLTGPGSVAHVVVGILASAVSIWLLAAAFSLRRVLTSSLQQHHLVHALGHIRSALLLKALLVFAAMVLGCFTFSVAGSLLFLLG